VRKVHGTSDHIVSTTLDYFVANSELGKFFTITRFVIG
jgi:hypothetical protein